MKDALKKYVDALKKDGHEVTFLELTAFKSGFSEGLAPFGPAFD